MTTGYLEEGSLILASSRAFGTAMTLSHIPRGCPIMPSTVEGKLFTGFYKGTKCPDVHNSVDWYPSSHYRSWVSTILGSKILGEINSQWKSMQQIKWSVPLLMCIHKSSRDCGCEESQTLQRLCTSYS